MLLISSTIRSPENWQEAYDYNEEDMNYFIGHNFYATKFQGLVSIQK